MTIKTPPFEIFKVYHAVVLHYTTDYDFQKYKGRTSYSKEAFDKRKDKYTFHKLANVFDYTNPNDIEYYFAWLFYASDGWINSRDLSREVLAFELDWRNYSSLRMDHFKNDMWMIKQQAPDYQTLFDLCTGGDVHYASILILDSLTGIIEKMNTKLAGQYLWDAKYKKLKKFRPFYYVHEPILDNVFKPMIPENICQDPAQ